MSAVVLSPEEIEAAFEARIAKKSSMTAEDRMVARADFDREMAERQNDQHDLQANYDRHKGRI